MVLVEVGLKLQKVENSCFKRCEFSPPGPAEQSLETRKGSWEWQESTAYTRGSGRQQKVLSQTSQDITFIMSGILENRTTSCNCHLHSTHAKPESTQWLTWCPCHPQSLSGFSLGRGSRRPGPWSHQASSSELHPSPATRLLWGENKEVRTEEFRRGAQRPGKMMLSTSSTQSQNVSSIRYKNLSEWHHLTHTDTILPIHETTHNKMATKQSEIFQSKQWWRQTNNDNQSRWGNQSSDRRGSG